MATHPPTVQVQKKRGMGCLGCGCSLLGVLVLLVIGLAVFGAWYFYDAVKDYTSTTSVAVPQFDGGDQVFATAQQNLQTFEQALRTGQPASLHLTADQINTLILHDSSFAKLQGHLFVGATGSEATIQFSTPLSALENFLFPERFLNGSASFGLDFDPSDHAVNLDLHTLHLTGRDLPAGFEDAFNRSFNNAFNQRLQANPAVHDFLNRVQRLTIENGALVIETK